MRRQTPPGKSRRAEQSQTEKCGAGLRDNERGDLPKLEAINHRNFAIGESNLLGRTGRKRPENILPEAAIIEREIRVESNIISRRDIHGKRKTRVRIEVSRI